MVSAIGFPIHTHTHTNDNPMTIHVPLQFNLFSSVIEKLFHWFYRGIIFSSQNFFLWWQPSWTSDWQNKNFWWRKCIPSNNHTWFQRRIFWNFSQSKSIIRMAAILDFQMKWKWSKMLKITLVTFILILVQIGQAVCDNLIEILKANKQCCWRHMQSDDTTSHGCGLREIK